MGKVLIIFCLLSLITACQNKKYDPESYKTDLSGETFPTGDDTNSSKLWDECLIFMNYCDRNYTADLKRFARDWLRTWEGWETDGVNDYGSVLFCAISTKSRYNVKSIHLKVDTDENPPVFEASWIFFSTEYDELVNVVRSKFGTPDTEMESQYGTIHEWYINETKIIKTVPGHRSNDFVLEYVLTN